MQALPPDNSDRIAEYAHPDRLVTAEWLLQHMADRRLVIVESDEDPLLYEVGHIPSAVKIDWHTDLNDQVMRDYLTGQEFANLMTSRGISRDSTVVIYGDKHNGWAAYTLWVFSLFGHPDVRLLDGGREKWISEGRPVETAPAPARTATPYPVVTRDDASIRAFKNDVQEHIGLPLIDIRSPEEYTGARTSIPDYPQEGVLRGGHIPGARNVPWARAVSDDGTFRPRRELEEIYFNEVGLRADDEVITYCRIGERSSHSWFALTFLLGMDRVRNYDGSWTEWGNAVQAPIAVGN
jgi:thiosulfate/3-mercaptopyruvate sulfurtransferase